jgi:membrane-bound serine protease (ClpP class)
MDDIFMSVVTTLLGLVGAIFLMAFGGVKFTHSKAFHRISLEDVQETDAGYSSSFYKSKSLVGQTGKAYTILRPSGRIEIEGELYDAYTRGEYIESGIDVVVISDEGTSLKVKQLK